ncbi:DUF805 domain-containing protein [Polaribacter ponticola]|uniref:DUF805 domain-containing protein n=1 Tax=Polaribacter ponticola TaxID=2978475 RepID=A0ABT5S7H0_9FLAO|nr:DUF805 domain-containing protein [Polaribacter sp. MSW5]MDD7914049.1 DUF805 domain-containing protein [Polaribacter sp. MSW5]
MKWYFKVIWQYFDFTGRARRKEFWVFTLCNIFILWALSSIDTYTENEYFSIAAYIFFALIFIPSITVSLRRLHDVGKTGWNLLLILIPIIGWLWLLMLLWFVGEPRANKWGAYPKGIEVSE